ncbi:LAME_0F08218g1_1 [Lachancea meyersii CBS 8951]|uniref:LAME_0F08218g1_1 n=1 Tax=Lachancea meyersii CBS 8951 TaxID=1266667 RepID=A0A1G4JUI7_9SACH|nr:LAME_0F08218g1_1 [Lachancea meyersii CBS 8951]
MRTADKNFEELCYWCRIGDVENVDRLISKGVNLNDIDEFNNSPLFLASLCGHEDLVNLLLKRGAICDRDRHEGARCVYGALTDSIRNILLNYDISKAVDLKQPFASHLSSQLNDQSIRGHDIMLKLANGQHTRLHGFLLAARSPYFAKQLQELGSEHVTLDLPKEVPSVGLDIISSYVYLVPLLHTITDEESESIGHFSQLFGFAGLTEFLDKAKDIQDQVQISKLVTEYQHNFIEEARLQMQLFVEKIMDNKKTVNVANGISPDTLNSLKNGPTLPDVYLLVRSNEDSDIGFLYPCHRSIIIRSDYFRVMFTSPFDETTFYYKTADGLVDRSVDFPIVCFPIHDLHAAELILSYLYYDRTEIPWDVALNVLRAADALLMERLKTMAAVAITQSSHFLERYSVFELLDVAWEFRVERLEHHVANTIAGDIEHYVSLPQLKDAILRSSSMLKTRQETDTIELIDDIRYYLLKKYNVDAEDLDDFDWNETNEGGLELRTEVSMYKSDYQRLENLLEKMNINI